MKQGLYEQIINTKILEELDGINKENFIIDKENIDKEEAKATKKN